VENIREIVRWMRDGRVDQIYTYHLFVNSGSVEGLSGKRDSVR